MPGADNPYCDIQRDGIKDARNASVGYADPVEEYNPRYDADLNQVSRIPLPRRETR
jgi:hypothetical protein